MRFWRSAPKADRNVFYLAIVCLTLSCAMLGAKEKSASVSAADDEEFLRFVDVAAEVYSEIRGKYVDEVKSRDILDGALAGMVSRLDEHSQYMDPSMLDSLNKDTGGEFGGIGIHITVRQGLLTVIAPIPGSPSAALGIMPWDRIIEIDGKTTESMPLPDAVEKLTGPPGTKVKVKIYREGETEPLEFEITRAIIKVNSIHSRMLEDNIGYLRIARFSDNTTVDMRRALLELKSQGMKALILDMRYNSGGLLREAIEVSNLFVPRHEMIVSTKGRLRSQNKEYRATEDPIINLPTFVLVNEGTASASEIVAGALQDHHLAVIIGPAGKNTFGKGSVQTIETLRHTMYDDDNGNPKDSALRITTAKYYTPSGRTIHQIGITPDIGIPLTVAQERDLLRHGLYGDTMIPLTKEEEEARDKQKDAAPLPNEDDHSPLIQRQEEPAPTEEQETPVGSTDPFYSKAKKPEFSEKNDFKDYLLDEALKQMKIYMILESTKRPDGVRVAGAPVASAEKN